MDNLVFIPDQILRQPSLPVEFDEDVREIVQRMIDVMYDHDGIGLAAPQIGILRRIIVIDVSGRKAAPIIYINPEITYRSFNTLVGEEGCLSIPGAKANVERAANVIVQWHDLDGNHRVQALDDLHARCMQHEVDHLNGILFIDHLSKLKRDRVVKKAMKARPI